MTEYGFVEGTDFFPKMEESTGGRPSTDYEISVDMAKHVRMIQRLSSKLTKTQRVADPGAGVYFRASRRQFTLVNYLKIKRRFGQNLIESDTTR